MWFTNHQWWFHGDLPILMVMPMGYAILRGIVNGVDLYRGGIHGDKAGKISSVDVSWIYPNVIWV